MNKKVRVIAFYLPQFHPIPENDEWWGLGFTEWTNVTKAKPLFRGHYQPHLPSDLGFCDLRVPEVRQAQADLARDYGLYGFCYYHYWFNGKRLLERPAEEVLISGKPDFPFMFCWANENWTRVWEHRVRDVLLEQIYSEEDDREHIKYLIPFFKDKRYIRINNKPVFCIYRSTRIPDLKRMIEIWRAEAAKEGLEIYFCRAESFEEIGSDLLNDGLDAAIEFSPHFQMKIKKSNLKVLFQLFVNRIVSTMFGWKLFIINKHYYSEYVRYHEKRQMPNYKLFPSVTPNYDNSPRRGDKDANVWIGSTPELFSKILSYILDKFIPYTDDENLVFINAWNEWAEGNHLEPDRKWGKGYLNAIRSCLQKETN
jgi:lipopolysaccharide biosynthesis protein